MQNNFSLKDEIVICDIVLTCLRRGRIGLRGLIRLIIIRHYESDEDLGFGFDGGCDAACGMPTGEEGTGRGCAC